jgi:thiol-disulfide isomerase/thioredoxin
MTRGTRLFAALCLLTLPVAAGRAGAAERPPDAPRFSLPTPHGTVALDSLQGHVALVDFWASWCEPCRRSFPWLSSLQQRYAGRGLVLVAIDVDKDRAAADAFLSRFDPAFTVAFDPAGRTAAAFKVRGMPSSFVIDPAGHIVYSHVGFDPRKAAALEAAVRRACGT